MEIVCIFFGPAGVEYIGTMTENIENLIETHSGKTYASAYRLTGNEADACDLVQETFIRVMEKIDLYDPEYDFGGWLHRVLYRVYLNKNRSENRRREVPLEPVRDNGEESAFDHAAAPCELPENIMEKNERRSIIATALSSLPAEMRVCVTLVDIEGHNYEEAAKILDWPVGSVSGRLFRARRLLRDKLAQFEEVNI